MQHKRLVFDIEMIGEDFDSLDVLTKKDLMKHLPDPQAQPEVYEQELQEIKDKLVFSPLTGQIVAIGVYDPDTDKGAVYYDANNTNPEDTEEDGIKYVAMTEAEMLTKFWTLAEITEEFVSFFGRRADAPYMAIRSAVNGVRPTKDLISNRYNSSSQRGAIHWDLFDLLTFYGSAMYKGSLHRWCRAFGIDTPKSDDMDGSKVGQAYKDGEYLKIAKYNAQDLRATAQLFEAWQHYLNN